MITKKIQFVRGPSEEPYGTVAVFEDLYGNFGTCYSLNQDSQAEPFICRGNFEICIFKVRSEIVQANTNDGSWFRNFQIAKLQNPYRTPVQI